MSRAIDALTRARRLEANECTGVCATWCPIHGNCTCPYGECGTYLHAEACDVVTGREFEIRIHSPTCALHGPDSLHCS